MKEGIENMSRSQQQALAAAQYTGEKNYWLRKLSGQLVKSSFPPDYKDIKSTGQTGKEQGECTFHFTGELFSKLMKLRNGSDPRLHMILAAGLVLLLDKYTGNGDVIFGSPTLEQEIDAQFINTVLVLRNRVSSDGMTFKELLLQVRRTLVEATEHQNYPVEKLPGQLDILSTGNDDFPLFDTAILLENIHDKSYITHLPLNMIFSFLRTEEGIRGKVEYNPSLYGKRTVEKIGDYFTQLLLRVSGDVNIEVAHIDVLPEQERKQLLVDFNDTVTAYPAEKKLHQLFEDQVTRVPGNIAVIYEDQQLTYRELNALSNRAARFLKTKGVGPGRIAALAMERSLEMIIGILGILKAGGAYLPIEPQTPPEKIKYIVRDAGVEFLIVKDGVRFDGIPVTVMESGRGNSTDPGNPEDLNQSTDPAYIIFTSGTTGKPKGVVVEHRGIVNTLLCRVDAYKIDARSVSLQLFSYAFDGFLTGFFTPVISGGKVILLPDESVTDITRLKNIIAARRVTHLISVPAFYRAIIENLTPGEAGSLELVTLAGDKVPAALIETTLRKNPGTEISNEYGITETSVMSTIYRHQERDEQIKIGYPIWNAAIYILDTRRRLQPVGIPGELYIAGTGVAAGYLNKPLLTAERFVPNPFAENQQDQRMYRTGDIGRRLSDGAIELLGRSDFQVKVRGYRIELEEIETQLQTHPEIKEAVIMAKADEQGDHHLYAYIVKNGETSHLTVPRIKEYLSAHFPGYMVPAYFGLLEEMPVTPTGKIDRNALLELGGDADGETEYVEPRNRVEELLAEIWRKILEREPIGIKDNFFNIGGDSIKTISLLTGINEEFDTSFKAADLYENETIEKIARLILENRETITPPGEKEADEYGTVIKEMAEWKTSIMNRLFTHGETGNIDDIYPLSDIEKGMIFHSLKVDDNTVYYNQMIFQVKERGFDADRLKKALVLMVEKHPILRTGYKVFDSEEPFHIVYKDYSPDFSHYDIVHLDRPRQEEYIAAVLEEDRKTAFNINDAQPLWRMKTFAVAGENTCFVWGCHHAVIDGWSSASLITELNNTYLELKKNPTFLPGKLKNTYKQFVLEQAAWKRKNETAAYWKNQLAGYKRFEFPGNTGSGKKQTEPGRRETKLFPMAAGLRAKLKQTAAAHNTSVKHLCFGAYVYMLSMISYHNDFVVGLITSNRPVCEDGDKIIGCFLNTVPVRVTVPVNGSWADYIGSMEKKLLEVKRFDMVPLFQVTRIIGEKTRARNPISDTIFNYMDFHVFAGMANENEGGAGSGEADQTLSVPGSGSTNTLFDVTIDGTLGRFNLEISFSTSLISERMVEKLAGYFEKIVNKFVHEPRTPIDKDEFMAGDEKHRLLHTFNDTKTGYPADKSIHRLFEEQVEKTPGKHAVIEVDGSRDIISYKELNRRADRLAAYLRLKGTREEEAVGIMAEPSIGMIVGLLAILKAGGAYLPVNPQYPRERKKYLLTDAGVNLLLSDGSENIDYVREIISPGDPAVYRHVDENNSKDGAGPADRAAYIIYTSGSGGSPKGVVVEHRNVVRLVKNTNYLRFGPDDRILQTGALEFDASTFEIWGSLLNGLELVVADKETILTPARLKETIREHKISTTWFTAPLFNRMVDDDIEIFQGLRNLLVGGDVLSPHHIRRVKKKFPGLNIVNGYGPTENTTFSTTFAVGDCPEDAVPIGKPIANSTAYIVDEHLHLLPRGIEGELVVGGDGVARGYLNDPELTAEKFLTGTLFNDRLYRTGDLARLLPDGNIAFSGRMDDQVKIRGFRVEPGEVTTHLTDHEDIKDAVVTVWESSPGSKEDKYLCAYIVSDREIPVEQLRESLSEKLPRHMIPSYFVQVEEIPLTGNGKVDRRALPEPGAKPGGSDTGYTAPRDEMEIKLAALWREILRTDQLHTPREIGIDDDFFDMGGHSLKAVELVSRLHKELNVKISLTEIFRLTTIRRLSQYLTGTAGGGENRADRYTAVQPVEKRDYYALSSAQERMYILQRMALENIAYNIPAIFPLEEKPETAGLETVFKKLIDRHESLRTSFHMVDNQPVQKIHHDVEFKIETPIVRTEQCSVPTFINDFVRFFDLSAAPLLRVGVLKTGEGKYSLMVDIHHIISDGVSQEILAREFTSLYKGETLPPLRIQYKDFTHWQNSRRRGDAMKRQEEYWLNTFKGGVPLLNIPTDYPRPPVQDFQGDSLFFKMDPGLTAGVKELTAATGTTLFMVSLAAYYILLSKYTAQEDIVVGVPVSGRSHADLQNVIGMFVNTLALRNHPRNESTFREFLEELKENTLHAFENQDYPFESLVEALEIENDPGRQPLVDAVFTLQNVDVFNAGAQSDPSAAEIKIAKFDLQLAAVVRGDEIELIFDYRRKLFKKETIGQMSRHFLNIIVEAAGNPGVKLLDIEMIKKEEEQELIKMIKNGPAAQLGTTVTKKIEAEFDF